MINPGKFSVSTLSAKKVYKAKVGGQCENSRLQTEECHETSSILQVRDCNYSQLRKTSSTQFPNGQCSAKENLTLCKFFRNKKAKSQFSKGKSQT